MNSIKEVERINQRELELGVTVGKGSWHDQYRDSAYVFVGGLNFEMTEGDVITVLSQWGEIMDINMPRDKETGKPRGFAFVMYEDQRSTVLAVDNMNGAQVLGRTIRVDHCSKYKQQGSKNEEGVYQEPEEPSYNAMPPTLDGSDDSSESSGGEDTDPEDKDGIDEEDPMAIFIKQERKEARALLKGKRKREGESKEEKKARKEAKVARKAERDEKRRRKAEKARGKRDRGDREERGEQSDRAVRDERDERDRRNGSEPEEKRANGSKSRYDARRRSRTPERHVGRERSRSEERSPRRNGRDYRDFRDDRPREEAREPHRNGRRDDYDRDGYRERDSRDRDRDRAYDRGYERERDSRR